MKPAVFDYVAARSVEEAHDVLARYGNDARVLAGGQSLIPLLNQRLVRPRCLIDIGPIEVLRYVREERGALEIGAGTSQRDVELHPASARLPVLREVLRHVGYPTTRNRGTVCGSLAYADPTAELPLAILALDGSVTAHSTRGMREIRGRYLYDGPFRSTLRDDELLTAARFPLPPAGARTAFAQFDFRRRAVKISALAVARLDAGRCERLDLALSGVAETPVLLSAAAGEALLGEPPSAERIAEAATRCTRDLAPFGDRYASPRYRTHVATQLLRQALERVLWNRP